MAVRCRGYCGHLPNPPSLPQSVAKGTWGRKPLLQAQACLNGTGLAVPVQNGLPHGNMEQEERRAEGVSQRVTKHLDNAARCLPYHLHARGACFLAWLRTWQASTIHGFP